MDKDLIPEFESSIHSSIVWKCIEKNKNKNNLIRYIRVTREEYE